jgi:hypothetical protein
MFSILKRKKKEEPEEELISEVNKPYNPFPELSGEEKFNAVEHRVTQKFREALLEGKDLTVGDVCDDLDWLFHVMNYGKDSELQKLHTIQKRRIITNYILHKDPELWAKIEKIARQKLEKERFDYQAQYIVVSDRKSELPLFASNIMQSFPDFTCFLVFEGAGENRRIRRIAEDYKIYEELEIRLLQEGYRFVREDAGSRIYWKENGRKDTV